MKVGIAADHGGFYAKQKLAEFLHTLDGIVVVDYGANEYDAQDDYPDFATRIAQALAQGEIERGIAICGSGVGASIAANKVPGVRAALICDTYSAHQGVEHDDMNIICFGARVFGEELIKEMTQAFLKAEFSGEERHTRRLNKVKALEQKNFS
uniref:RpiB/LacA/LacB family sugar-phosphate isomerase n=1 Tax=Roseihalotalea indica TaxID=2867963 RepID=A0AA49JGL7_9BACT|nr:RpiB/LacA/LacB family sugar-phosphate isomerase [Tunicatimonas sp. TK19036]